VVFILVLVVAFAIAKQVGFASTPNLSPMAQMVSSGTPAPIPPFTQGSQTTTSHATLSSSLSYYFISGNTFTSDLGSAFYARQVIGCVNQMPLNWPFSAPIHLPQGSQIVSITLYTYDNARLPTTSTGYFIQSDGQGNGGAFLTASSQPNTIEYQQNDSTQFNPVVVDNQNYNYLIQWRKLGDTDSLYLSLCGVRIAYYAPLGALFLPVISK
jgi:hypothetical protein